METRSGRIDFVSGASAATVLRHFDRPVRAAHVALAGYEARYLNSDHHVRRLTVQLNASPAGRTGAQWSVRITGTLILKDDNDERYAGWIDFLLFVELEGRPGVSGPTDAPIGPER